MSTINVRIAYKLAELGGQIYALADDANPEFENSEEFQMMMYYLNQLCYKLIHGDDAQKEINTNNETTNDETWPF